MAEAAPALVDPGTTAVWGLRLDEIVTGKAGAEEVWEEISEAAAAHVALLRKAAPGGGSRAGAGRGPAAGRGGGKPTPKQLAFAEGIAKAIGKALPAEARSNAAACSAFIDANKGAPGPGKAGGAARGRAGATRRTSRAKRG